MLPYSRLKPVSLYYRMPLAMGFFNPLSMPFEFRTRLRSLSNVGLDFGQSEAIPGIDFLDCRRYGKACYPTV